MHTREHFDKLRINAASKLIAEWLLRHPARRYDGTELVEALSLSVPEVDHAAGVLWREGITPTRDIFAFSIPADSPWREVIAPSSTRRAPRAGRSADAAA